MDKITRELGKHYRASRDEDKLVAGLRQEFFDAATAELETRPRSTRVLICNEEDIEGYVRKHFPGWRLVDAEHENGKIIVEEDPAWMPYSYISKDGKTVYQRGIAQESPALDDEAIRNQDPELWYKITECPIEEVLWHSAQEIAKEIGGEVIGQMQLYIEANLNNWLRILKPLETLDDEDFEKVQQYIVPGKLSHRLTPPRKPKPEELE